MASAYGHRREYKEWVNPYDVQLSAQVNAYRQNKHDENFEKIQSLIDQYGSMDLVKDEDKMYLFSRLQTISNELNKRGTMKLDSKGVEKELEGVVRNAIDSNVLNAYKSSQIYRSEQSKLAALEKLGEKGGYHKYNALEVQEKQNEWLKDGKVGSVYSGTTYTPYINVQEKYWKKMQELYKDMEGEFDVPLVGNDGKVVPGAMVRKKVKGMNSVEIRNIVESSMTPEEQEQLRIDAKWGIVYNTDPKNVVSMFNDSISKQISSYENQLSKVPVSQSDLRNLLKSNIEQLKTLKNNSLIGDSNTKEDLNKLIGMATYLNRGRLMQFLEDSFSKRVLGEKILENPVYWKEQSNDLAWERLRLDKAKFKYEITKDAAKANTSSSEKSGGGEKSGFEPLITNKATDKSKVNEVATEISHKEGELWNKTYQASDSAFKSLVNAGVFTEADLNRVKNVIKQQFPSMDDKTLHYEAVKQLVDNRDYLSPEVTAFKRQYDERKDFINRSNEVLNRNVSLMDSLLLEEVSKPDFKSNNHGKIEDFGKNKATLLAAKKEKLLSLMKTGKLSKDELESAVAYYVSDGGKKSIPSRGEINNFLGIISSGKKWEEISPSQRALYNSNGFNVLHNDLIKTSVPYWQNIAGGTTAGASVGALGGSFAPVVGTTIGAVLGASVGALAGIYKSYFENTDSSPDVSDSSFFEGAFSRGYRSLYGDTVGGYNMTYKTFNSEGDRKSAAYDALGSVLASVSSNQVFANAKGEVEDLLTEIGSTENKQDNIKTLLEHNPVTVSHSSDGKNIVLSFGDGSYVEYPMMDLMLNADDTPRGRVFKKWMEVGSEVGERINPSHLTQSVSVNKLENIAKDANRSQSERDYARTLYGESVDTSRWAEQFKGLTGNNSKVFEAVNKIASGNFGSGRLVVSPADIDGTAVESFRLEKDGKILLDMNVAMETGLGAETIAEQLAGGIDSAKKAYYIYLMIEQKLKEGDYQSVIDLSNHFN